MVDNVVDAVLPGRSLRVTRTTHPYTNNGLQIDVGAEAASGWVEIGECGTARPSLLAEAGLTDHAGLAMGLGLDRLLMLRKGIDDIRLLRAEDPRIASQMLDLQPYRPVSVMPPIRRDLSVVVSANTAAEEIGDRVRIALGVRSEAIESVTVIAESRHDELPAAVRLRLGMDHAQKNVLLRVVLREVARTMTHSEANELRDAIYLAIHEGRNIELASSRK
jgi:phenylalanyl-tRNA synthetase alpha chain